MSDRDDLIEHLQTLSPGEVADGIIATETSHEARLAELHDDNDVLWDTVHEQGDRIVAAQRIHDAGYAGRCRACKKQRHPGPCATSVALGVKG